MAVITFANAKLLVARVLGADTNDADRLASAGDAIAQAIEEWNLRHDWQYLLMDTSNTKVVAGCTSDGLTPSVITTTTALGFAGVNVGQTFTGMTGTGTVTAVDTQTQIKATPAQGGSNVPLTFAADIPLRAGADTYNLPSPIKRPHTARLVTNQRTLLWKDQRWIDRSFVNQSPQAIPSYYNTFNTINFVASPTVTSSGQNGVIRLFPMPGLTDSIRVRYYRPISQPSGDSDILDVLDRYSYALLELASYYFLRGHDSENPRTGEVKERAEMLFRRAVSDDTNRTEDNEISLIPQMEHGSHRQIDSTEIIWAEF